MIFLSGASFPVSGAEIESSPFTLDLQFRGFIIGSILRSKTTGKELCRYVGGLPYAQPPVGPNRFLRPRELAPCYQFGTRGSPGDYTGQCNVCPQAKPSKLDSEDCLQLNIYIPAGQAPAEGNVS
jgi:carboxylesterase type B